MKFSNRGNTANNAARLCEPLDSRHTDFLDKTRKDTTPPPKKAQRAAQDFARRLLVNQK